MSLLKQAYKTGDLSRHTGWQAALFANTRLKTDRCLPFSHCLSLRIIEVNAGSVFIFKSPLLGNFRNVEIKCIMLPV